jgi:hypothetical protein
MSSRPYNGVQGCGILPLLSLLRVRGPIACVVDLSFGVLRWSVVQWNVKVARFKRVVGTSNRGEMVGGKESRPHPRSSRSHKVSQAFPAEASS